MFNNKLVLFFLISTLYSQEFDPDTGDLIKKKFNPKTGELVNPLKAKNVSTIKNLENISKSEKKEVEVAKINIENNQIKDIKKSSLAENDFDRIYFEETMYLQYGFWSPLYVKNGGKISNAKIYKELEYYSDSRNLYDEAQLRFIYGLLSAGLVVVSPFLGASTENFMVFFTAYLGGFFSMTYNAVVYSNLIKKSVWIFNREALKANLDNKQK